MTMNPGYMSLLMLICLLILLATGWRSSFSPNVGGTSYLMIWVSATLLFYFPLWWRPAAAFPEFRIHIGACMLVLASAAMIMRAKSTSNRFFMIISCCMLAILWGGIQSLYAHDPLFYRLDASWGAPLLCGLLCCAFASGLYQQLSVIAIGAFLGELLFSWLESGTFRLRIGALAWSDRLWAAAAAAMAATLLQSLGKTVIVKIRSSALRRKENGQA